MNNFSEFIRQLGYEPRSEIIPDKFIRFGRKDSVSAKLFADEQAGYLKDWRSGEKHYWFADDKTYRSSQVIESFKKSAQVDQIDSYSKVAIQAKIRFDRAIEAPASHPYLIRKQVKPYGICIEDKILLIPVYSVLGDWQTIQFIDPEGNKKFLKGGKVAGGCYFIGLINLQKPIYLSEGFATGASVHEETQCLTIVAFNASNLVPVAIELRKYLPDIEIVIAGDTDQVGRQYAELASKTVNGSVTYPPFAQNQAGTDWNDYLTGVTV